jgi:hypothetical protein
VNYYVPVESIPPADDYGYEMDDGTMPDNVASLAEAVVGHRIVSVERTEKEDYWSKGDDFLITLDNGKQVRMQGSSDCCAYTELESFLLHPERVDHVITGVGTTGEFDTWHIFADMGDVLELKVGWSCGNPFYYGYGFNIRVRDIEEDK